MSGFTLLEVIVVVTIISLLTLIVTAALPAARAHQTLRLATQQVSDVFAQASHRALNEVRPESCTSRASQPKRCSDVGVALGNNQLILFADTTDPQWHYTAGQDEVLATIVLPTGVTAATQSFVFTATPPTLEVYADGKLIAGKQRIPLTLTSGDQPIALTVSAYGQVE
jgi:prepilin-type N-terminal cleavage/methylation domain-containing protein